MRRHVISIKAAFNVRFCHFVECAVQWINNNCTKNRYKINVETNIPTHTHTYARIHLYQYL